MKKAFSLFEVILVLVIISILAAFSFSKLNSSLSFSNKAKIKSEIALIRNGISKKLTSNTLLNTNETFTLDDEPISQENSPLFNNVLKMPLLSTSKSKKELAKWIKISSNIYKIYFNSNEYLEFSFANNSFICKSEKQLCERFE